MSRDFFCLRENFFRREYRIYFKKFFSASDAREQSVLDKARRFVYDTPCAAVGQCFQAPDIGEF